MTTNRNAAPDRAVSAILLAVVVVVLAAGTFTRNYCWSDKVAMWQDVVEKSPRKARAHNNLGEAYHQRRLLDQAIGEYAQAIALNPYLSLDAYSNMASIFMDRGEYDRAIQNFTKLLFINAGDHLVYANRGNAYFLKGAYAEALRDYDTALSLAPGDGRFYLRRGDVYLKLRNRTAAAADFLKACGLGEREACAGLRQMERTGGAAG